MYSLGFQQEQIMPKIYLIDVTNRDGVQTAKLGLSKLEKTMLNILMPTVGSILPKRFLTCCILVMVIPTLCIMVLLV